MLAVVVDVGPAAVGERRRARPLHRAGGHQRAPRPGRLAEAELAGRVDDDVDARRVDAELLGRHLQGDGVHALAHLRPAVADLDPARRVDSRNAHDGAGHLAEAVAEPGVLQPEAEPDRLAGGDGRVVGRLDRVEARLGAAGAVVHDLARTPHRAGADDVALADLPAADADLLGQPVEHAVHRELRLVGAEAAERAAHEVVGARRDGLDVDGRHVVRAGGVAGGPLEHLHPDRGVGAGVADRRAP